MDKQILENNIKGLKKARDACRSQLDIGGLLPVSLTPT